MGQPQGLETLSISYSINQPADPNLWNGSMHPVSIFRLNDQLDADIYNITISLLRIVSYIREWSLEDKIENLFYC